MKCRSATTARRGPQDPGKIRECEREAGHTGRHRATYCGRPYYWQPDPAADLPKVIADAVETLAASCRKHPSWPTDPLHASAVVSEESGELTRATLIAVYETPKAPGAMDKAKADMRKEALQTIATCMRFILAIDRGDYDFTAPPGLTRWNGNPLD